MSSFPPYTAGALHILSHDLVQLIAPPSSPSRLFVMNEDQNLGLWLYPSGVRPIHDHRIQQAQVCEDDMVAKHFGGEYTEPSGLGMRDMYKNIVEGRKQCTGLLRRWCGVCYPGCRGRDNHWREWGFACDDLKGATLSSRAEAATSPLLDAPLKTAPEALVMGSASDPWVIPALLTQHTSTLSHTQDWHLLHMLCWTTGPETFQERHYHAMETIWAHEPRAILVMMATKLPLDFFDMYTQHGYRVHVVRVGGQELLANGWYLGDKSEAWLHEWDKWTTGPNLSVCKDQHNLRERLLTMFLILLLQLFASHRLPTLSFPVQVRGHLQVHPSQALCKPEMMNFVAVQISTWMRLGSARHPTASSSSSGPTTPRSRLTLTGRSMTGACTLRRV